jgi:4-deoxy-L-threo-5-hexosulose-uronate ketol-isomerase
MRTFIEERWGTHPGDVRHYDTSRLRKEFLVERLFAPDEVLMVYTHNDRLIIGGAMPTTEALPLEAVSVIRSSFFCQRRELGIICIENEGRVTVDGTTFKLGYKDAVYVGRGAKDVVFETANPFRPAKFYFASAPAHSAFPTEAITANRRRTRDLGDKNTANERLLNQIILNEIVPCCQLQMGLTELKSGSVWNTMPSHTHSRRMEAYFYFRIPEPQIVCHFMGEPNETRHIFVADQQAVISPPWSIHSAAGTSNYAFIWAMCGENLDYDDMDIFEPNELK